jgi:putative FmdB family regulatory protein
VPTYSYACTECGNRFDAVQAFTDDALTTCPQCSGRLRKLYNSVGIVFKGSGFYRTDSREAAKSATNGSATSESDSGASKTESSTSPGEKSASSDTSTAKSPPDKSGSPASAAAKTAKSGATATS